MRIRLSEGSSTSAREAIAARSAARGHAVTIRAPDPHGLGGFYRFVRRFHRRLGLAGRDLVELLVQVSWAAHLRAGPAPGPILGMQALRGCGLRVAGVNLWTSSGDCCAVKGSLEELTPARLDWLSALPKHGFGAHVLNAKSAREIERETAA